MNRRGLLSALSVLAVTPGAALATSARPDIHQLIAAGVPIPPGVYVIDRAVVVPRGARLVAHDVTIMAPSGMRPCMVVQTDDFEFKNLRVEYF